MMTVLPGTNQYKVYVAVTAETSPDGVITPLAFVWEDGRKYEIDRVLDARPAASLKAGGNGIRYTIRVMGRQKYLFLEEKRWFMERK
jgi:hypothetical protein